MCSIWIDNFIAIDLSSQVELVETVKMCEKCSYIVYFAKMGMQSASYVFIAMWHMSDNYSKTTNSTYKVYKSKINQNRTKSRFLPDFWKFPNFRSKNGALLLKNHPIF